MRYMLLQVRLNRLDDSSWEGQLMLFKLLQKGKVDRKG
jgi:hypothetical protein